MEKHHPGKYDPKRLLRRYYSDSYDADGDKNPPKKFKQENQRKFRHKQDRLLRTGEEVIETDYKMPYYT